MCKTDDGNRPKFTAHFVNISSEPFCFPLQGGKMMFLHNNTPAQGTELLAYSFNNYYHILLISCFDSLGQSYSTGYLKGGLSTSINFAMNLGH
jgi:hypothetical protein